jgi:hypothetical protein
LPLPFLNAQAAHPDTDSAFEIQPSSLAVGVGQGDATAGEEFVVTGFSVSGRVVDSSGNGVPTVAITVNGVERATTDLNGRWGAQPAGAHVQCVGQVVLMLAEISQGVLCNGRPDRLV